ncbi:MAG: mannosyltransferase family protein [Aggregatilineales bacterium]
MLIFTISRIIIFFAAYVMVHNTPVTTPSWLLGGNPSGQTYQQALPIDSPLYNLTEPWHRWDTAWYIKVAIQGYRPGDPSVVFPPLYPVIIRLITPLCGGNYVLASLLVSNIACFVFLILFFKFIELEFSSSVLARVTIICLIASPSAYYLTAGYSESLFLCLSLGAFYSALKRIWWLAGVMMALATLTRLQGAALCIPLGWIAYVQFREAGIRAVLARIPAILGGPLSALAYVVYLALNGLLSLDTAYLHEWQLDTRFPWESVQTFFARLSAGHTAGFENNNALALLFVAVTGLFVIFKLSVPYKLYICSTLFILLLRYHNGSQFEGMIRYVIIMFPCFIIVAMPIKRWWLLLALVAVAIYGQFVLLDRFVHWVWVA